MGYLKTNSVLVQDNVASEFKITMNYCSKLHHCVQLQNINTSLRDTITDVWQS